MRREVLEEAGATLTQVQLLGYQWIRILGPTPPGYRYPCPESYQMLYVGQVEALQEFPGTTEARSRALFAPEEARSLRWVQQNRPMYEAALQLIRSRRQEARGIQP